MHVNLVYNSSEGNSGCNFIFENEKQTGLSIKQAAIAQGVQIKTDFVLRIERGGGKTELIGDGDIVKVRDGDRFLAIPNDDNS